MTLIEVSLNRKTEKLKAAGTGTTLWMYSYQLIIVIIGAPDDSVLQSFIFLILIKIS